jgi:hypothetical protein
MLIDWSVLYRLMYGQIPVIKIILHVELMIEEEKVKQNSATGNVERSMHPIVCELLYRSLAWLLRMVLPLESTP